MSIHISSNERVRWIILPVTFTENGQIKRFEKKLPSNIIRCIGVLVSLKNADNTNYNSYAELSLSINNNEDHILNMILSGKTNANFTGKHEPFSVNEKIENGKLVSGYIKDLGVIPVSHLRGWARSQYTINVYLKTVVNK